MKWKLDQRVNLAGSGIDPAIAARQQATAAEMCRRLNDQPGVVLADEVGMGKTFVALAVAASAALADRSAPVVVMVPSGVAEKWVKEFAVFTDRCLQARTPKLRVTDTPIRNGTDFLCLLDDPPARRRDLIVMTHGALSARLSDPWVELALIRQALLYQRGVEAERKAVARWAANLFPQSGLSQASVAHLLATPLHRWPPRAGDDPVPRSVAEILGEIDLSEVREAVSTIPRNHSASFKQRIGTTRKALRQAVRGVWPQILSQVDVRLPLLILDEAHHVKNENRLAQLFANPDAAADAQELTGALGGMFERMLFLTATPFQLGHGELLRVLERFEGVDWRPPLDRERFRSDLHSLRASLDLTQADALRLERAWGRLDHDDAGGMSSNGSPTEPSERLVSALAAADQLREAMLTAQGLLRPWVIRHMRPGKDARRSYRPGTAILEPPGAVGGLPMSGDASLPFLLATRAQVLVGLHGLREHRQTRAFFAEGLASSFEAYRFTRRNKMAGTDDRGGDETDPLPEELTWYLDHIDKAIPTEAAESEGSGHPKLEAVVDRAAQLWVDGHKLVIFCFYVETGKALRAHLSRRLRTDIAALAGRRLGLDPANEEAVFEELGRIGDRIEENPLRTVIEDRVRQRLGVGKLSDDETEKAVAIVRRFLRTPSFLARFVELPSTGGTSAELRGPVMAALERPDGSGSSMAERITRFGGALVDMVDLERIEVLDALQRVTTGGIRDRSDADPGEMRSASDPFLPNVRLANGSVPTARRRALMLGFNSPFFPEVLVASAVMAEGIDLHLECRHVIHHDLDWSPSTLEQRTGRVDRIGSKSERLGEPIEIYEPYMAGMYDEKVYKVVKDRERWFNVVMGEQIDTSEWATERAAARVPLPADLAASLTFDLALVEPDVELIKLTQAPMTEVL